MTDSRPGALSVVPVHGLPEIHPGDDLGMLIAGAIALHDGDVVVVAQKVVSKAEGALVRVPSDQDRATVRGALVREQAVRIVAEAPWTVIVETRHGLVCANAGIDASNVAPDLLALLPEDPDASARRLRDDLRGLAGVDVAVVVTDTFGRPWRIGHTDVAIGLAGLPAVRDERGGVDRFGAPLDVTVVALADEVAAAADLVRRKADGVPVVVVRGLAWKPDESAHATDLQRPPAADLFPRGRGSLAEVLADPPAPARQLGRAVLLDPDDWRRAWKAADRAGDGQVAIELVRGCEVRLEVERADPDALVSLGAVIATLRATLADFGWATAVERPRRWPHRAIVRVGDPQPTEPWRTGTAQPGADARR